MTITIYSMTPDFAAEIGDVNLASISDADMGTIKQSF